MRIWKYNADLNTFRPLKLEVKKTGQQLQQIYFLTYGLLHTALFLGSISAWVIMENYSTGA